MSVGVLRGDYVNDVKVAKVWSTGKVELEDGRAVHQDDLVFCAGTNFRGARFTTIASERTQRPHVLPTERVLEWVEEAKACACTPGGPGDIRHDIGCPERVAASGQKNEAEVSP